MSVGTPAPLAIWFGGQARLAAWIAGHFPAHRLYCEAFGGSAAVLLSKEPAPIEVCNDLDGDLVNLFRVVRSERTCRRLLAAARDTLYAREEFELALQPTEDPVEAARRYLVRQWQSYRGWGERWDAGLTTGGPSSAARRWLGGLELLPAMHARFQRVRIERRDWREVLDFYDRPSTLFYVDPFKMTEDDHIKLVDRLLKLRGLAAVFGYRRVLYYDRLTDRGWRRVDYENAGSLWLSPYLAARRETQVLGPRSLFPPTARDRRIDGARLTHLSRTERSRVRIMMAIRQLSLAGAVPTRRRVAEMTGMSREHVGRRYGDLFKI